MCKYSCKLNGILQCKIKEENFLKIKQDYEAHFKGNCVHNKECPFVLNVGIESMNKCRFFKPSDD